MYSVLVVYVAIFWFSGCGFFGFLCFRFFGFPCFFLVFRPAPCFLVDYVAFFFGFLVVVLCFWFPALFFLGVPLADFLVSWFLRLISGFTTHFPVFLRFLMTLNVSTRFRRPKTEFQNSAFFRVKNWFSVADFGFSVPFRAIPRQPIFHHPKLSEGKIIQIHTHMHIYKHIHVNPCGICICISLYFKTSSTCAHIAYT